MFTSLILKQLVPSSVLPFMWRGQKNKNVQCVPQTYAQPRRTVTWVHESSSDYVWWNGHGSQLFALSSGTYMLFRLLYFNERHFIVTSFRLLRSSKSNYSMTTANINCIVFSFSSIVPLEFRIWFLYHFVFSLDLLLCHLISIIIFSEISREIIVINVVECCCLSRHKLLSDW